MKPALPAGRECILPRKNPKQTKTKHLLRSYVLRPLVTCCVYQLDENWLCLPEAIGDPSVSEVVRRSRIDKSFRAELNLTS